MDNQFLKKIRFLYMDYIDYHGHEKNPCLDITF